MAAKKAERISTNLSVEDIQFIFYAVSQHIDIVKNNRGIAWDASLEKETACLESLRQKLPSHKGTSRPKISRDDFWFLEFTLNERKDFINEGLGTPWFQNPRYDSIKTSFLIDRLRRALGITCEELEQGMPY